MKIPLEKVGEGADLCLDNASQFCSDAIVLSDKSSYDHALALCIFAVEELGKAVLLKERAAYALKDSGTTIILKHEKPEVIFNRNIEDLKAKGFSGKGVNPFYHHLTKLLYASNMMYMATRTNVMKSIEGQRFQSMDEIDETISSLWKEANAINVYHTDLRELALYVDYDQEKGIWSKGRLKLTPTKIRQLAKDIQTAIELLHQWKTPSPLQKQ